MKSITDSEFEADGAHGTLSNVKGIMLLILGGAAIIYLISLFTKDMPVWMCGVWISVIFYLLLLKNIRQVFIQEDRYRAYLAKHSDEELMAALDSDIDTMSKNRIRERLGRKLESE
ncbi:MULTISPECIES: hypothetical protein [Aeromonas]|uniref:hypothetical protein n=1 Tax=Aeromonas TaxID=642 RepID=UPI002B05888C|nr:hypothetical protein [Aeromonas jandaei]